MHQLLTTALPTKLGATLLFGVLHPPLTLRPTSIAWRSISGCRNGAAKTSSFPLCPDHRPGPTLLKNSFSRSWRKQNCSRMRYKRSSRIPRHFVSPKFWLFSAKREFFNTNRIFHQPTVSYCNREFKFEDAFTATCAVRVYFCDHRCAGNLFSTMTPLDAGFVLFAIYAI